MLYCIRYLERAVDCEVNKMYEQIVALLKLADERQLKLIWQFIKFNLIY